MRTSTSARSSSTARFTSWTARSRPSSRPAPVGSTSTQTWSAARRSTGCWWDPWWGYVCTTFYDTYSDTRTGYTYSVGVRWDLSDSIALRAAYGKLDMDTSHATKDVNLDTWRAEIVWKF